MANAKIDYNELFKDLPADKVESFVADLLKRKEDAKIQALKEKTSSDIASVLSTPAAEGKTILVSDMLKAFHALPTWKDIQTMPASTIFRSTVTGGAGQRAVSDDTKAKVLKALRAAEDHTLTTKQIVEDTEIGKQTVGNALGELVSAGKVKQLGTGRRDRKYQFIAA